MFSPNVNRRDMSALLQSKDKRSYLDNEQSKFHVTLKKPSTA